MHSLSLAKYLSGNLRCLIWPYNYLWRWRRRSTTSEWLGTSRPPAKEKLWSSNRHWKFIKTKAPSSKWSSCCQGAYSEHFLITRFLSCSSHLLTWTLSWLHPATKFQYVVTFKWIIKTSCHRKQSRFSCAWMWNRSISPSNSRSEFSSSTQNF